ncbi:MAG: hypothetical protein JNG85_03040 [Spirochaetaceae bacterium]|nr:hypothetical protein [Spirochaetaceae bacterium]
MTMSMVRLFIKDSALEGLSATMKRRIPFLVYMNVVLILGFVAISLVRFMASPALYLRFFLAVIVTESCFMASLVLLRIRRFFAASYLASAGTMLNVLWLGLFLPFDGIGDFYRFFVYLLAAVTTNSMIALGLKQMRVLAGFGLAAYLLFATSIALPRLGGIGGADSSIVVALFILLVIVLLVIDFQARLNTELVRLAERELAKSRDRAESLARLVAGTRGALATGRELGAASEASREYSSAIKREIERIGRDARDLSNDAAGAENANRDVVERSKKLKTAVAEENGLLTETNDSLARILATVRSVASLAADKKSIVGDIMETAERQGRDLAGLKEGVERVRASSSKVFEAASGISDLSEKTGLLAMNASIQAARAGAAGKGFAVISQGVRKLADDTRIETGRISLALAESGEAARTAEEAVDRFSAEIARLAADVRSTFDALVSILDGLGTVSSEAAELERKAAELVKLSVRAEGEVEGAAIGIETGAAKLLRIKDFSVGLAARVESIFADFSSIERAVEEAARIGGKSLDHATELDEHLAKLDSETKRET